MKLAKSHKQSPCRLFLLMGGIAICSAEFQVARAATTVTNPPASKPVAAGPSRQDIAYYKSIYELNIFDPNRVGPAPERAPGPPIPKVDAFGLVGVMSYEKGKFAFFDGTTADFKKAAKLGDKLGDFEITEITDKQVKLKSADKEIELPLASQLRREDKGEWKVMAMTGSFTASYTPSSDSGSSSSRMSSTSRDSSSRSSSRGSPSDFGGRRSRNSSFGQDAGSTGGAPASGIMSNAATGSTATAPASDSSSSNNDGLSILERLKKKREQEQKQ